MTANLPRILIVDDQVDNRELLKIILTHQGYLVVTAAGGELALAMVAEQPPDLILIDVLMPGIDGYQVVAKLKGNLATRPIPVIMVSGLDDHDSRMRGRSAGADGFICKPLDRTELFTQIRTLLPAHTALVSCPSPTKT